MQILVGVVVYQRIDTIQKWLQAWNKSDKFGSKLAVFHNYDSTIDEKQKKVILDGNPDYYIQRKNIGCDLGALQDVINGVYELDWDVIIWFCDDIIPMKKDFLRPFIEKITHADLVGACYEPANETNKNHHFRTVAFALRKDICKLLKFPANPMINRPHCFEMEHGSNNMTIQIEKMAGRAIPAIGNPYPEPGYSHWPNNSDWLWDCHLLRHFNLWNKFEDEFR